MMNKKKTILVVDDSETIRRILQTHLKAVGYNVWIAINGKEAVAAFEKQKNGIDLVLLDQNMPEMDGLETLEKIHELDGRVPVIMMTAFSSAHLIVCFMQRGGDDFVEKPLEPEILKIKIERAIKFRKMGRTCHDL